MYTTPATGSSANPNDLEDYLLGKKRVDKMLIGDEHEKVRSGAPLPFLLANLFSLSSVHRTRVSLLFRMQIPLVMLPTRSARILFSL